MADVKIKCEHTVIPNEPTWSGTLPLSEFDQASGFAFVPYIYFYKPTQETANKDDVTSVLKESLSRCLFHFYPMAGRIHRDPGGRMELRCNAMGAVLAEAETSSALADMGDFSAPEKFEHLSYAVNYTKPTHELALLYAQLTWFSCGGFSLAISISHTVTDGLGGHHLISEWTRFARGETLERVPYLQRDVLGAEEPPREPPYANHSDKEKKPLQAPPPLKQTAMVNLALTKKQVEMLKMVANSYNHEEINGAQRPYTRFEALTAHIWRCVCKARGHDGEQPTAVGFSVDSRTRMRPPLPPNFWGNAVLPAATKSQAGELISKPLGFGCSRVRSTIEKVTSEYIWSDIEHLKRVSDPTVWPGIPVPEDGSFASIDVMVVSWLRLPLYGRDFGWGNEVHMGPAPHPGGGTAMVLPGRGEEGSLVVEMRLQVAHVDKFKRHFYSDIVAED